MECQVTRQEYIDFITFSLTLADPCAPDFINSQVLLSFWTLQRPFSMCNDELLYLLVRREALKLLMLCTAPQVNTKRGQSDANSATRATTRLDGYSQRQATNSSSGRADSVFTQRYNDANKSRTDATTTLVSQTIAHDRSESGMSDTGHGESRTDTSTSHLIRASGYTDGFESEQVVTNTRGQGGGCVFDFSADDEKSIGDTDGVGAVGDFYQGSNTATALTGWSTTGGRSVSQHFQTDYSWSRLARDGGGAARLLSANTSTEQQRSNRQSSDWFHAVRDEHSSSQEQSDFISTGRGTRDGVAHADGSGSSKAESKTKESGAGQSTSLAHEDNEARREMNATSFAVSDFVAAGQRYQHLRMLFDNTLQSIEYLRMLLKARMKPSTGLLEICEIDGYCTWGYMNKAILFSEQRPSYVLVEVKNTDKCLLPMVYHQ